MKTTLPDTTVIEDHSCEHISIPHDGRIFDTDHLLDAINLINSLDGCTHKNCALHISQFHFDELMQGPKTPKQLRDKMEDFKAGRTNEFFGFHHVQIEDAIIPSIKNTWTGNTVYIYQLRRQKRIGL